MRCQMPLEYVGGQRTVDPLHLYNEEIWTPKEQQFSEYRHNKNWFFLIFFNLFSKESN